MVIVFSVSLLASSCPEDDEDRDDDSESDEQEPKPEESVLPPSSALSYGCGVSL